MLKEFQITLIEVTTKTMTIVATDLDEAENTAMNFHLGMSDEEENARIKALSTTQKGSVYGEEDSLSEGWIHIFDVD